MAVVVRGWVERIRLRPTFSQQDEAMARAVTPTLPKQAARPRPKAKNASAPRTVVGQRLIDLIRKTLIDRGLPERHMVALLGVSQSYWHSLANGHRSLQALSKEKLQRLATFLELPLIQVCVLAGQFTAEDFVVARGLDEELERRVAAMRSDARWLALAPTQQEWAALPLKVRMLVVALYESGGDTPSVQWRATGDLPTDDLGDVSNG